MTAEEHIEQAKRFLAQAEREFEAGDQMQASEKLWGAASHAVMAAAQSRDMPSGSHRAQRVAVEEFSAEQNDPQIKTAYALAGKFHSNFYHGFMEEEDWVSRKSHRTRLHRTDAGTCGKRSASRSA